MDRKVEDNLFSTSDYVKIICQESEVFKKIGITLFEYSLYFDDGKVSILSTNPEFEKHYVANKLFPTFSESLVYKKLNKRFTIMSHAMSLPNGASEKNSGKYIANIITAQQFSIYHRLYFATYYLGYIRLCGFGINHDSSSILETYMNNAELLEKFVSMFEEKAKKLIDQSKANRILLPGYCDVEISEKTHNGTLQQAKNAPWSKSLSTDVLVEEDGSPVHLTCRELESLALQSLGRTAKEISCQLKISHRTVEKHINNARDKLGPINKERLKSVLMNNSYCKAFLWHVASNFRCV